MTIMRDNVPMYPMNPTRQIHLRNVARLHMANLKRPLEILEVGCLLGDSTKILGEYGHVFCVDLWDYEGGLEQFTENTKDVSKSYIVGSSVDVLPKLPAEKYDLICIDGDHTYPVVYKDMMNARRLIKPGGVICGDDLEKVLVNMYDADYETAYRLRYQDYVNGYHPGVSIAVHSVFWKVNVADGFWWWVSDPA